MRLVPLAAVGLLALVSGASAQEDVGSESSAGMRGGAMSSLLSKGYEIKAAVNNGTRLHRVFAERPVSLCLRICLADEIAVRFD